MNQIESANQEEKNDINLTPMLDVVFILLIFFVVTASFVRETGIGLDFYGGVALMPDDLSSIIVMIESDDSFHINGRALAKGSLTPFIRRLAAENPDADLMLKVSSDAHVDATVAALDAARQAGFATIPIEELQD